VNVTIEGHCDERGTIEYNLALGERRAKSARDYLIRFGLDRKRFKTVSYGEERPVDLRQNEEAWAKNRRAEFVVQETIISGK
jgi:peptidoglycan-associated lipoprotein